MNSLKSRAERGPHSVFFARWGGERGTPIATSDPEVLSSFRFRAQLHLTSRAQRAMPRRVLEVLP